METNYKQKAIDHVRSVCPELMNLSFGCEIVGKWSIYYVITHAWPGEWGKEYDVSYTAKQQSSPENYISIHTSELEEYKIIGHTPHLEHWLRGVNESQVIPMPRMSIDGVLSCDGWAMQFNLQTGQPAQEEDYKAYCMIAGI